jgi:hypothetical protein
MSKFDRGLGGEAVLAGGDILFVAETVPEQVHGAEAGGGRNQFDGVERRGVQVAFLVAVEVVIPQDVVGGREQKAAGPGRGIDDGSSRLRAHDFDDGVDEDAGPEILAGAGLGVLGVLFEQALVYVALDVGAEHAPGGAG